MNSYISEKKSLITSIRIMPNDKVTFKNESEFRYFIEYTMSSNKRKGKYYFPGSMMRCKKNTLVLFQYDGMIRAIGLLIDYAKGPETIDQVEYAGYYKFDTHSLKYLDVPISRNLMKVAYPGFTRFSQSKQIIPMEYLDKILSLI